MKSKIWLLLLLPTILFSTYSYAAIGPGHVSGSITNITSVGSGILIRIGANQTPENCTSTNVWMEIKQERTAMISMALTAWTLGRGVTVYTSPGSSGLCQVIQVDPAE